MKMIKLILFLVCLALGFIGRSQVNEQIILFTDRDVYASSEEVFAEIYLPFGEKSKIVYVDLADYSGNHITGINLKVEVTPQIMTGFQSTRPRGARPLKAGKDTGD